MEVKINHPSILAPINYVRTRTVLIATAKDGNFTLRNYIDGVQFELSTSSEELVTIVEEGEAAFTNRLLNPIFYPFSTSQPTLKSTEKEALLIPYCWVSGEPKDISIVTPLLSTPPGATPPCEQPLFTITADPVALTKHLTIYTPIKLLVQNRKLYFVRYWVTPPHKKLVCECDTDIEAEMTFDFVIRRFLLCNSHPTSPPFIIKKYPVGASIEYTHDTHIGEVQYRVIDTTPKYEQYLTRSYRYSNRDTSPFWEVIPLRY